MVMAKRDGWATRNRRAPPSSMVMSRLLYSKHSGSANVSHHGGCSPSPNSCQVQLAANPGSVNGPTDVSAAPAERVACRTGLSRTTGFDGAATAVLLASSTADAPTTSAQLA